ncbi:hypothetical protein K2Z84_07275 [Candidatus Binatia bacterium]|nr:hypothetical protein [Candidatus Binatia bacterium]
MSLLSIVVMLAFATHMPKAAAHGLHFPKRDAITLAPGRVSVAVGLDLTDEESRLVRDRFDLDGDGRLAEPEQRAIEGFLAAQAQRNLWLRVDGTQVALRVTARQLAGGSDGRGEPDALGIEVVLEGEFASASPMRLEFGDATRERRHDVGVSLTVERLMVLATSAGRLEVGDGQHQTVRGIQLAPAVPLVVDLEARR